MEKKRRSLAADAVLSSFLDKIEPLRKNIENIILFGSRSRDDWRPDSDYDLLLVMPRKERAVVEQLYEAVMDILLETGKLISLKIFPRSEFERLQALQTPFMTAILAEGVTLG